MTKLITIPEKLLTDILPFLTNTPFEQKIKDILQSSKKLQTQDISYFPKKATVDHVVDGDTIVLTNGIVVRYVGVTAPEDNEPFDKESTEANRKLVEGKEVKLEYDAYKADKFGRILAYVIADNKNISIELARLGFAQAVVYEKRRPFIYQQEILKAQDEAKKHKRGMWSK